MYSYSTHIKPFSSTFQLVKLTNKELQKIDNFTKKVILKKENESQHQIDNRSEYKRFFNGTLGEVALEKFLNISGIVDWSIGDSKKYHKPDLSQIGIKVGVKSVDYGLFPVIFKNSYSPEIINIIWKNKYVYVCGLASIEILNEYQSFDLIKDEKLRLKGTKTGFYGFEHLKQFTSINQLKNLI